MFFLNMIVGFIAYICFALLYEHINAKPEEKDTKMSKKGVASCTIIGISMTILFFVLASNSGSGSSSSSKYKMIENEDGTRKYYDTDKWKDTDDGKHIYDGYGNVKDK